MKPAAKSKSPSGLADNALATRVLQNIEAIDRETRQQKLVQVESLNSAKAAILSRMNELTHQLQQLDSAMAAITGRPAASGEKRIRKDWTDERERVGRWLQGRSGQKFLAGDLAREFPELEGQIISLFLKPLVAAGTVKTDSTSGPRRTKYFVEA